MSGHSHAKTIMHRKTTEDAKRGKVFSKLSRLISIASKGGGNPDSNPQLKQIIEEAKAANMPKENIERAIKKGTGEIDDGQILEEFSYEAFGPNGAALIIEGITDNKNRALAEIRQTLNQGGGKLANEGSVRWLFGKKGIITIGLTTLGSRIKSRDEFELAIIEAGADDLTWRRQDGEEFLEIHTKPEELELVKKNLQARGLPWDSATLGWAAKEEIMVSGKERELCEKLFKELNDNDAIQETYSNLAS